MMTNLGEFIKKVREGENLSQSEVARRAGLARSYVSRLEEGKYKSPSPMTLIRLARGLGVSNEKIFVEAGVSVREKSELPAFDVYCRTKFGLPEEAIKQMQAYLDLLKTKYANNNKQQSPVNTR